MRHKTYKKKLTKRRKQIRIYLWLMLSTALASYVIINWDNGTQTYMERLTTPAIAQIAPERLKLPEMSVQEHVWHLLRDEAGLSFEEAIKAMSIVDCESKWNKEAEQYKRNEVGVDRGLWQFNSYHHPEVMPS